MLGRAMIKARKRGVTLIEVMIVTAIIGVLAGLAYVGYGRYVRSAKMTEAYNMVNGIKAAQEHYKTETGFYADVSGGVAPANLYPKKPGPFKTAWGGACGTCNVPWTKLDVKSDAPVWFGYATRAGDESADPAAKGVSLSIKGTTIDFAAINGGAINKPWYVVVAQADTNGDGIYALVVATSFSTEILTDTEGE